MDNLRTLSANTRSGKWVLYAINAVDNLLCEDTWRPRMYWLAKSTGIPVVLRSSKRDLVRGYESKLVSQLPLLATMQQRVAFDYVFTIDGDISFVPANVEGLIYSLAMKRPLIAQPTILQPNGPAQYDWGPQWFKPLNDRNHSRLLCQPDELVVPFIESQSTILSSEFLHFYREQLESVARAQHAVQCDWGHDEMWCSAASRYASTLRFYRPPCMVIAHSVLHLDTKGVSKDLVDVTRGDSAVSFVDECVQFQRKITTDKTWEVLAGGRTGPLTVGPLTGIYYHALKDFLPADCLNEWLEVPEGGHCERFDEGLSDPMISYRQLLASDRCARTAVTIDRWAQQSLARAKPEEMQLLRHGRHGVKSSTAYRKRLSVERAKASSESPFAVVLTRQECGDSEPDRLADDHLATVLRDITP
jgi:hypothetical protein